MKTAFLILIHKKTHNVSRETYLNNKNCGKLKKEIIFNLNIHQQSNVMFHVKHYKKIQTLKKLISNEQMNI